MVEAREGYRLAVRFLDGVEGTVDLSDLITSPMAGVFTDLCDKAVFASARVEGGAVTWTNGLDLAPDAMYRAIRKTGLFQPKADVAA
jgi:hypothetical protein